MSTTASASTMDAASAMDITSPIPSPSATTTTTPTPKTRKRARAEHLPDDGFRSKAIIGPKREINFRQTRQKPVFMDLFNMVNPDEIEIDEYDKEEQRIRKEREEREAQELDSQECSQVDEEGDVSMTGGPGEKRKKARARKSRSSKLLKTVFVAHKAELGSFNGVPPEIIEQIAGEFKFVADTISFLNTCRTMRNVLGKPNRLFWYGVGKNAGSNLPAFETFDPKLNYFTLVRNLSGAGSKNYICNLCFKKGPLAPEYECFNKMRACSGCLNKNVIPLKEVKCIPGLKLSSIRPFNVMEHSKVRAKSPKFDVYDDHESDCYRLYVWKPRVERMVSRLYPGKSFETVISETDKNREEFDIAEKGRREQGEKDLVDYIIEKGTPIYQALVAVKKVADNNTELRDEGEEEDDSEIVEDETDKVSDDKANETNEPEQAGKPKKVQLPDHIIHRIIDLAKVAEKQLPKKLIHDFEDLAKSKYAKHVGMTIQRGQTMKTVSPELREKWAMDIIYETICTQACSL